MSTLHAPTATSQPAAATDLTQEALAALWEINTTGVRRDYMALQGWRLKGANQLVKVGLAETSLGAVPYPGSKRDRMLSHFYLTESGMQLLAERFDGLGYLRLVAA